MLIFRFLTSFGMVTCVYLLYSVIAVPLIEPTVVTREIDADGPSHAPIEPAAYLADLFPEGAWERSGAKEIESGDAVLMFQQYALPEDGTLELKPCTVIYTMGSDEDPRRLVLQAPAGALLEFEGPVNLTGSRVGRLVNGMLRGEILISSPESRAGANDRLRIETRNVQVKRDQIWTPHDVKFQYGQHFGAGRDLVIRLDPSESRRKSATSADVAAQPLGDVRSLELVHLDRLRLWLPADDLFGGDHEAAPTPIDISCRGPFVFDFQRLTATFSENVQLVRTAADGAKDELRCSNLEMTFFRATDPATASTKPLDPRASALGPLKPQRIVATGSPVVIEARSMDAAAEGERLVADITSRRVRLDGRRRVWARHELDYVEAVGLEYEVAEDSKRLGRFWSTGPGYYIGRRDEHEIQARWNQDVHLQKQDGQHVLSIVGGGRVEVVGEGWLEADQVHVWLEEVLETPGVVGDGESPEERYIARPTKMLAEGNVRADSPELAAATKRLEAWFRYVPAPVARPGEPPGRRPGGPLANRGDRAKKVTRRMGVAGDLVRLQVLTLGKEAMIEEATIDGQVEMRQLSDTEDGHPLTVVGDQMKLTMDPSGHAAVDIVGRPARAQGRGMSMEGNGIHLRQRDNHLWIAGPGQMMLPAKNDHFRGLDAAPPIFVNWQGGMAFNGLVATFDHDVVVRGKRFLKDGDLLDFTIRGSHLEATMTEPVRLDEPGKGNKTKAELSTLKFPGMAFAQNQTYDPTGAQISYDEMELRDLTVSQPTGELRAEGPGWLTSVRYEDDRLGPPAAGLPAQVAPAGASRQLVFLRVAYRSHLTGDHQLGVVHFHQVEQVVYGPVPNWTARLDPTRRDGLGKSGVFMTCDKLSVASSGHAWQKSVELKASGNVSVEGQVFAATAGRLSYDRAKDQLLLESDGRNNVLLEYQRSIGAMREKLSARQVIYWPGRGDVRVVDGDSINLIGR